MIKVQMDDIWVSDNGKEPKNNSPMSKYCRKLVAEGVDPKTPLEVYRGDILCLSTKAIGECAKWKIREDEYIGPIFVKYRPFPVDRMRPKV